MASLAYMWIVSTLLILSIHMYPFDKRGITCSPEEECPVSSYCAIKGDSGYCVPCAMICTYKDVLHQSPLCRDLCPDFTIYDYAPDGVITTTLSTNATDASTEHHCYARSTIIALSIALGIVCFVIIIEGVIMWLKFKGIQCFKKPSQHTQNERTEEQVPLQPIQFAYSHDQQNEDKPKAADVSISSSASHCGDQTDSITQLKSVDVKTARDDKAKQSHETCSVNTGSAVFTRDSSSLMITGNTQVAPDSQDLSLVSDKKHTDSQFGQNTGPETRHEGPNAFQPRSDVGGQVTNSEQTYLKQPHGVQESLPQGKLSNATIHRGFESETSAMTR